MEKLKYFLVKYKWYIAGGVGLFIILYFMRGGGSSSATPVQMVSSTPYLTGDGTTAQVVGDPTVMLAQLSAQTNLASQQAQLDSQYAIAQLNNDLAFNTNAMQQSISLATIDANKYVANLDATTQVQLAGFSSELGRYQADISKQIAASNNQVAMFQMDTEKFIANRQADITELQIYKQASLAKREQNFGFINNLISAASSYFKPSKT